MRVRVKEKEVVVVLSKGSMTSVSDVRSRTTAFSWQGGNFPKSGTQRLLPKTFLQFLLLFFCV